MTSRNLFLYVLLALLPTLSGCQESPTANQPIQKLVVTGSSTIAPLIADIGKRFEEQHPGVRVDVQTGGSSRGVSDTRSGIAHIGMASRALHDQEILDLIGTTIAQDGIGLIVHTDNPIENLTTQQVIDVFTGRISNWRTVGGVDAPVVVVNKAEGRATLELFLSYFHLKNSEIQADVIIGDNEQGIKTVAGNPHAIGYVSIGTAEYDATHGVPIKLLRLNTVSASLATVQSGQFPISRPLNLVTTRQPNPLAQTFIDFAISPHVQDLVTKHYFVPLPS